MRVTEGDGEKKEMNERRNGLERKDIGPRKNSYYTRRVRLGNVTTIQFRG